ncbi:hypothetical protein SPV1_14399 [Mariprofundus ferrooxydans PV-1]|uniref:Uncharacterized protein n=1 Tax=Mariprofundus ferrooxydans PV-1 TaxID=314345 RepID=Q0EZC2_9PROT|nr:hypothetical protein SPV1_14399 [Mariprofundus ferrooxydans PV-1]
MVAFFMLIAKVNFNVLRWFACYAG